MLVVDDDSDCRTIYAMHLRSAGCDVFTANDGRAAVDKTNDLRPDIIVMDLAMPRVDGWEAIRRLHDSSWTRQIPIIAVSAVPTSRDTAFEAGCDAYLAPPCASIGSRAGWPAAAVASTVDEFLHGHNNAPVFLPDKKPAKARKPETPSPSDIMSRPVASIEVAAVD